MKRNALRAALLLLPMTLAMQAGAAGIGTRYPSEKHVIVDKTTGVLLTFLTSAETSDAALYQTHPRWTYDSKYIIFRSSERSGDGTSQAYAVSEETGVIIQLTEGTGVGTGSLNVSRLSNKLYYFRTGEQGKVLTELDLERLLADSEAGTVGRAADYERAVGELPSRYAESGGFTLDADETKAYVGVRLLDADPLPDEATEPGWRIRQVRSGIIAIDIQTGEVSTVIETPFTMGHVQANPFKPGEILYCWETGGDAPQRMWVTSADGSDNRPLYEEGPDDWVTHEVWIDADHVYFNMMGHLPRLRKKATGVMKINVRTGALQPLGQLEYGSGFWHCGGTSDLRWAASDNFEGEVYLIDCQTGQRHLFTANHRMQPDHTHPSFSPDNSRMMIQSGYVSDGKKLDIVVVNIPFHLQSTTSEYRGEYPDRIRQLFQE